MSATKRWLENMIYRVQSIVESKCLDKDAAIRVVAKANRITYAELKYWVDHDEKIVSALWKTNR